MIQPNSVSKSNLEATAAMDSIPLIVVVLKINIWVFIAVYNEI